MSDGEIKLRTSPEDPRFPNTNQAQHCWTRYNEWVLCTKRADGDDSACIKQRQLTISICPSEWVENWDEQRGNGNFAGVQA